jgi:hypothetical protein
MKMAKASMADMEMALKLCGAFNALENGDLPAFDGDTDPGLFDEHDDEQAAMAMRQLLNIVCGGSLERVIWGMHVLMDPENKLVDPDADTLERHPDDIAAAKDAERYRWIRGRVPGGTYRIMGVIYSEGGEGVDAAIDAAMSSNAIAQGREHSERPAGAEG